MIIYKITNKINGKVYIGQTVQYSTRRISNHKYYLRHNKHYATHMQRAWNKYGEDSFTFEHIDKASNIDELNEKEQYWIAFYKSIDPNFGYNSDRGGKNKRMTDRQKEALRQRMIGNTHSVGKKQNLSDEQRKRRSETAIKNNTGRIYSKETRKKIGDHFRGEKSVFFGKPGMNSKQILYINENKIYHSILTAAKELGHCRKTIRAVCDGKKDSIKGRKFKYA